MPDQEPTMAANPTQSGVSPDCDHMSRDNVIAVPRNRDCDGDMSSLVAEIEERIQVLDTELAQVAPLALERERLLEARARILGLPRPARAGRRVTRDEVASVLRSQPGLRAGQIARLLGVGRPAVSAHLYRGKQSRFRSSGGRWFVADAK
jgi:hypothetical protein